MRLFKILHLLHKELMPHQCKIHLAGWNGVDDPLDVYLAGGFDDWQACQTRKYSLYP